MRWPLGLQIRQWPCCLDALNQLLPPAPLPGAPTLIGCATFRVAVARVRLNASVKRPRPWPRSLTGTVAAIGPTRRSQFPRRSCAAPPPACRSIFPGICDMSKRWPLNLSPPNRFPGEPAQSAELAVATSPVLGGSGKHPLVWIPLKPKPRAAYFFRSQM